MKLNKGFTLAEVLVTIAIIGVISAIVLPIMKDVTPNREQVMLKKAYYLVSRNVNEMINDEDLYPERDNENLSGFSNVDIHDQTADGRQARFHGQEYSGNSKFCNIMAARMNVKGNVVCNAARTLAQGGNFTTADGIIWSVPVNNFNRGGANVNQTIQVDVNGISGKNCFEGAANCRIPDRFTIFVDRYGKLTVPANGIEQEYLTRTKTNKSYGRIRDEMARGLRTD